MTGTGTSYTVADWFASKVAQEVKKNIHMCEVFGILKESDKAVYAFLCLGCKSSKTMWVPKSALIRYDIGHDGHGSMHYETMRFDSYDEAAQAFKEFWSVFD